MMQIGEVSKTYHISNRTLRYWEEKRILTSIRKCNGYRYYDDVCIRRIKQILFLRKLKVPVQDIECIFKTKALHVAIEVLTKHLAETREEAKSLEALSLVLERLISMIQSQQDIKGALAYMEESEDGLVTALKDALQISLSERMGMMNHIKPNEPLHVRLVQLPRMIFAAYQVESNYPEDDCTKVMHAFIQKHQLDQKVGFRHFGFNNPEPTKDNPVYGYEMWATIPRELELPSPLVRKEFSGGLFAAIPTKMNEIGERWGQLCEWAKQNEDFVMDWSPEHDRRGLEECIDYAFFMQEDVDFSLKQLDLLLPVKRKS